MNLLLDTHCLIWFLEGSDKLPENIKTAIFSKENYKVISAISLFEIAIKSNIKKLTLPFTIEQIELMLLTTSIDIIPIKTSHLEYLSSHTFYHKDPFDKLILSTAVVDEYILLSKDKEFSNYNIPVLWD
jgi:PIN domain nuclease of toxin-antitoxin system